MSRKIQVPENELLEGVYEIEHTADLGMEIEAASLEELFQRAATGMMALVRSTDDTEVPGAPHRSRDDEPRSSLDPRLVAIGLDGRADEDVATLLVRWLRELLYLQEVDGFVYRDAAFERLDESGLRARVEPDPNPAPQIRELKGVTYHGLEVERREGDGEGDAGRWRARVIFDI